MQIEAPQRVRLSEVCARLEAGWRIEEPIVRRSAYYTSCGRVCALELALKSQDERRVVTLDDLPEVQAFLKQRQLAALELA
jgi:hypothetical protein